MLINVTIKLLSVKFQAKIKNILQYLSIFIQARAKFSLMIIIIQVYTLLYCIE